jgi:hypothetical protein
LLMLFLGFPFRAAGTLLAVERTFLKDAGGFSLSSYLDVGSFGARARAGRDKAARTACPDHCSSLESRISTIPSTLSGGDEPVLASQTGATAGLCRWLRNDSTTVQEPSKPSTNAAHQLRPHLLPPRTSLALTPQQAVQTDTWPASASRPVSSPRAGRHYSRLDR